MSLAPGTRFGPYTVVALLGSGGMGEVYRARDTRLGRDVAVKILSAAFAADPDRLRRFERATVYAGLGDKRHALEWLKKSHAVRADCTPWANVDGKFDPFRNEPEFKDLARLMRFKP